jgi:hypothetical protein
MLSDARHALRGFVRSPGWSTRVLRSFNMGTIVMNTRYFTIAFSLLVVTAFNAQTQSSPLSHAKPGVIARAVAEAKATGAPEIEIGQPIRLPTGVQRMDDVVQEYSVIKGEPMSFSTISTDANILTSWYVFHISDVLIRQREAGTEIFAPDSVTARLSSDMVAVPVIGGQVTIDGIVVKQRMTAPFQLGHSYFLLLLFDSTGRGAVLAAQEDGIFEIAADRTLRPLKSHNKLAEDIDKRWGSRFDTVSNVLKSQAVSRH